MCSLQWRVVTREVVQKLVQLKIFTKKKTRKRLSDYVPCLVCHPVLLHLQPPILERRSILAQFQVLLSQAQTSKCVCIEETMLVFYVRFVCFSEHTEYNE